MSKRCCGCGEVKALEAFNKHKNRKDGRQTLCTLCSKSIAKTPAYREKQRVAYGHQKDRIKARNAAYKKRNRQRYNALAREAFAKTGNTPQRLESLRAYQQRKRRAMPSWADRAQILAFYVEAKERTDQTGLAHEVDHIVPLISKIVCGLHVQANLQVLTQPANRSKGNLDWPGRP